MDLLPNTQTPSNTILPKEETNPNKQSKPSLLRQIAALNLTTKIVALLACFILLIFLVFLVTTLLSSPKNDQQNKQSSTTTNLVEIERQRQIAASEAANRKKEPLSQLQSAYDTIVGSDSSKRTLTIDTNGVATIEYEIASTNGQLILKTSYENFADLSTRVFNIPTISRLNVTTFANKFTDTYGTPNVFAVKLQITKETNAKINWSLKKYSYADYSTLLTLHELNSALTKDYKALIKN